MDLVVEFMNNNQNLASVLVVVAVFRAVFKPLMLVVEKYVEATPDKGDDEKLAKFKESKAYQVIVFAVDYLLSIKLPPPKPKK